MDIFSFPLFIAKDFFKRNSKSRVVEAAGIVAKLRTKSTNGAIFATRCGLMTPLVSANASFMPPCLGTINRAFVETFVIIEPKQPT